MSFSFITATALTIVIFYLIYGGGSVYAQSTTPLQNNQIFFTNVTSGAQQHYYFNTQGSSAAAQNIKRTISYFTANTHPGYDDDNRNRDGSSGNDIDPTFWSTTSGLLTKRAPSLENTIIYLTLTSCSQPIPPPNYNGEIPSIDIYLSTVNTNKLPGPTNHQNNNTVDDTLPGRISWQGGDHLTELWIGVAAPTLTPGWTGEWTYELAVSTTQWMHPFYQQNDTWTLEDTDSNHALFLSADYLSNNNRPNVTALLTQDVPKELKYSYCAAKLHPAPNYSVNVTDTTRGRIDDNHLRQQLMISNLTQGQTYQAYMIKQDNAITGIASPLDIQMKSDPHCRMIYDLDFCDDVAYSVPTDPNQDIWNITRSYDDQVKELFAPFGTALTQFNCNSTQYSLVRNCDDCYRDYKRWLCAVTIPRCTSSTTDTPTSASLSDNQEELLPTVGTRDVTNGSSRNPWIDETYKPSGWTELLPCIDLCYHVVQSCPPFLQFNCPEGDLAAQQYGYWKTQTNQTKGPLLDINHPSCNRLNVNESILVISDANPLLSLSSFLLVSCMGLVLYIFSL
ncbi:stretch-activated Ca2+-permeable channel component-domain-containing protein, partial [Absidia repens]